MGSSSMTKAELLKEVAQLRKRVAALEKKSDRKKHADEKTRKELSLIEHVVNEWRRTFDSTESIIMLIDHDYTVKRANLSATKFFDASFQEIIGKSCSELFQGAGLLIENCPLERLKETKQYEEEEMYIPEKGVWLLVTASPVTDAKGNLKEAVYTMSDITEKIRLKDRLIAEKKFSEYLINSLPGIFYLFHESGVFLKWNKNLEQVTGYSSEEVSKMHPLDFFGADDRSKVEERIQEVFIKGASQVEAPLVTKSGKAIPYFFTGSRITEGGLPYLIGTGTDISDRYAAEEKIREYAETLEGKVKVRTAELERATFEAKAANKAKSLFLTNMSHELRTPLNSIIGFSEALLAGVYGDVKEEHKEFLQDILDSGTHLLSIISEILDLTKIETGRMELDREDCIISELVRSSVTLFKEKARKHNIDLQVVLAEELGTFFVDGTKIRQIFLNLLSNAFKFTPDNGSIVVQVRSVKRSELDEDSLQKTGFEYGSVQRDEEYVQCSVDDTGSGISEENQLRLFKPFEQLEELTDRKEGSGIGLVLTRRLVELHGGVIWCESPPQGKSDGSRFVFLLPRSVTDAKLRGIDKYE